MIERFTAGPGSAPILGPYSQATAAGGFVFTAGQVPLDASGTAPEDFADQVETLIDNLERALINAGSGLDHIVKVNGYLTEQWQLEIFNAVYERRFGTAPPARTTVCVQLWGVTMELECIAVRPHHAEAPAGNEALGGVELPTLGHTLTEGFCGPRIRLINPVPDGAAAQMCGTARTLDLREPDALAVNEAIVSLQAGEVLVIRTADDRRAPIGAVTAHALVAAGAAGVVIDGPVTDLPALQSLASQLPVYASGLTAWTTHKLDVLRGAVNVPVRVGDAEVRPGHLVAGDAHGVLILPPDGPTPDVLDNARRSDAAEPELLARIAAGEPLENVLDLPSRPHP